MMVQIKVHTIYFLDLYDKSDAGSGSCCRKEGMHRLAAVKDKVAHHRVQKEDFYCAADEDAKRAPSYSATSGSK